MFNLGLKCSHTMRQEPSLANAGRNMWVSRGHLKSYLLVHEKWQLLHGKTAPCYYPLRVMTRPTPTIENNTSVKEIQSWKASVACCLHVAVVKTLLSCNCIESICFQLLSHHLVLFKKTPRGLKHWDKTWVSFFATFFDKSYILESYLPPTLSIRSWSSLLTMIPHRTECPFTNCPIIYTKGTIHSNFNRTLLLLRTHNPIM